MANGNDSITQQTLDDFIVSTNAHPNATDGEIFSAFPQFKGDQKLLELAFDYRATLKGGGFKDESELRGAFPQFFPKKKEQQQFAPELPSPSSPSPLEGGTSIAPSAPGVDPLVSPQIQAPSQPKFPSLGKQGLEFTLPSPINPISPNAQEAAQLDVTQEPDKEFQLRLPTEAEFDEFSQRQPEATKQARELTTKRVQKINIDARQEKIREAITKSKSFVRESFDEVESKDTAIFEEGFPARGFSVQESRDLRLIIDREIERERALRSESDTETQKFPSFLNNRVEGEFLQDKEEKIYSDYIGFLEKFDPDRLAVTRQKAEAGRLDEKKEHRFFLDAADHQSGLLDAKISQIAEKFGDESAGFTSKQIMQKFPEDTEIAALATEFQSLQNFTQQYIRKFPELFAEVQARQEAQEEIDLDYETAKGALLLPGSKETLFRYNILNPIGRASVNFMKGIFTLPRTFLPGGKTIESVMANELGELADSYFDVEKATSIYKQPTALKGDLLEKEEGEDGGYKVNWEVLPSKVTEGLTSTLIMLGGGAGAGVGIRAVGIGEKTAAGAGLMASSFVSTHNDYYTTAIEQGLSQEQASGFAVSSATLTSALELINPQKFVFGSSFKKDLAKGAIRFMKDGATRKDAIKQGAEFALKQIGFEELQEMSQLVGDKVMEYGANKVFDKYVFEPEITMNEAFETVVITSIIAPILGGGTILRSSSELEKQSNYTMGQIALDDQQRVVTAIEKELAEGRITEKEADIVAKKVDKYSEIIKGLPDNISQMQRSDAADIIFKKELLKDKQKEGIVDDVVKAKLDDQAKGLDEELGNVLDGKVPEEQKEEPAYEINGTAVSKDDFLETVNSEGFAEKVRAGEAQVKAINDTEAEQLLIDKFGEPQSKEAPTVEKPVAEPAPAQEPEVTKEPAAVVEPTEPILQKFTTPTDEKFGTVNRQDGKGVIALTKEEFEAEQQTGVAVAEQAVGVEPAQQPKPPVAEEAPAAKEVIIPAEDVTEARRAEHKELVAKDDIEGINTLREDIKQDVIAGKEVSDDFLKQMELPTKKEILAEAVPEVVPIAPEVAPGVPVVEEEVAPEVEEEITRKERGKAKAAEGFEELATALGAIKKIEGNPLNKPTVFNAVKKIAEGLAEQGIANIEELMTQLKTAIKEQFGDKISEEDLDNVAGELVEGIEFVQKEKKEPVKEKLKTKKEKERSLSGRARKGTEKEAVKKAIEGHELTYEVESHDEAKESANKLIETLGEDEALEAVRNGEIKGAAAAFVWADAIDGIGRKMDVSEDAAEIEELSKQQADLIDEFDENARDDGRFISALQEVYKTSDFGYQLDRQIEKYKEANDGVIPIEVEAKFREFDKKLKEANKKLHEAEERLKNVEEENTLRGIKDEILRGKQKKKKIKEASKRIAASIRKGKIHRPGVFAAATPGSVVWDGTLEVAATIIEAGGSVAQAVATGIKHIKASDWYRSLSKEKQQEAEDSYKEFLLDKEDTTEGELKIPTSVIKEFVERGIDNIEDLTRAVHGMIKGDFPGITEREVRDAITGYGKTVNMSKDDIDVRIRKMRRMGKFISGIEDVQNKKRPLRSGLQRDKLDAEERAKQKELRELMKDLPIDEAEVEKQWKSTLDAVKTRLRNSIEDLQRRLETGEKPPAKRVIELDAEAKALKEERDELAKILEEIEGKTELTDEQRVKVAIRREERAIATLERKIRDKELETPKGRPIPQTPELVALKAQKESLRDQLLELQKEAGIPEKKRLEQTKVRLQKSIDDLTERIETKNFAPKKRKEPVEMDVEATKLKAERDRIKDQFDVEHEKVRLAQRPLSQKIWDFAFDLVMNLPKTMRATLDLSAPFRQGVVFALRPSQLRVTGRAFRVMFQQVFSEKKADDWLRYIKASPEYTRLMKPAKLFLAEPNAKLIAREEVYRSNIADRIPIYKYLHKASQRGYIGFLNKMRVDAFMNFAERLEKDGHTMRSNPELFKAWADYVNNATGRGTMGKFEQAAEKLNNFFFSPRLIAARFNLLNPVKYAKMPKETRKEALKSTFEFIGTGMAILMMAAAAGADVEDDPRSSDFGKIKIGSVRIDIWGGFAQWVRLFAQFATGERKSTRTGEITVLGESYGSDSRSDIVVSFFKYKLSPTTSAVLNLIEGENAIGEDVDAIDEVTTLAIPLYLQDVNELLKEEKLGDVGAAALIGASFFGIGVMQYEGWSKQKVEDIMDKRAVPTIKVKKTDEEKKKQERLEAEKEKELRRLSKKYGIKYVSDKIEVVVISSDE